MKIGIIAKHELYFTPIVTAVKRSHPDVEVVCYPNLSFLNSSTGVKYDYLFFPHFSDFIPQSIYMNNRCVGFHVGDLPKDRGGSPIQNKIRLREYNTYLNAFIINGEVDGGPVMKSLKVDLSEGNISQILESLAHLIGEAICEIVSGENKAIPQEKSPMRFSRLTKIDSLLSNNFEDIRQIYDQIRMLDGLDYPRSRIQFGAFEIEFEDARFEEDVLTARCRFKYV